jgi:DNA-binding protein H-NS
MSEGEEGMSTVAGIEIDKLSPSQLQALIQSAQAQIEVARKEELQTLREQILGLLREAGYTIDDVFGHRMPLLRHHATKGSTVEPKYRFGNETWSGRGKRPRWLADKLEQGATLEDFLIK